MKFRAYNTITTATLRLLPFLCVLLFAIGTLLRAIFLDDTDGDAGLLLDHFIASVVAKNISQGLGWVTTGYETFLLNPESLTGPTVVVPMALAIAVFGNQLAVPGLAMATLNVLLLFGVLLQSRRYWPELSQHTLFMLPLLALFASLWPHSWYRAGGEVTAALLLTNAALLLATSLREHSTLDWRTALLAGLLAGLAATSKQLALLACAGLACAIFFSPQFHVRWKIRLLFCLSMALPYGAFTLYQQLAALSADPVWWAGTEFYRSQLFERYSGLYVLRMYLDPEIPLWPAVVNNATNALRTVQEQLVNTSSHPAVWLFWPPLLAASLVLAWRKNAGLVSGSRCTASAGLVLSYGGCIHPALSPRRALSVGADLHGGDRNAEHSSSNCSKYHTGCPLPAEQCSQPRFRRDLARPRATFSRYGIFLASAALGNKPCYPRHEPLPGTAC